MWHTLGWWRLNVHTPTQSRLVAVVPPPGTTNVASHLVTLLQRKKNKRKKNRMDGDPWMQQGERDGVRRLKLAVIPPQGFARTHRVQSKHTEKHTHTLAILDSPAPSVHYWWSFHIWLTQHSNAIKANVQNLSCAVSVLAILKPTTDRLSSFCLISLLSGDLGLRPAGAGHEVDRPAHSGAPDVPDAPEHDPALRQTQPPHQHVPLRPQKCQGSAVGGESYFIISVRAWHKE